MNRNLQIDVSHSETSPQSRVEVDLFRPREMYPYILRVLEADDESPEQHLEYLSE